MKVSFLAMTYLLGALLVITASGRAQSPPSEAEPTEPGRCRIVVELQRKSSNGSGFESRRASADGILVAPLEPVWIKATLQNTTKNPIIVEQGPASADFQVQVRTEDRRLVPLTSFGKALATLKAKEEGGDGSKRVRINLNPGQEVSGYYQVDRQYDMTLGGAYRIRVSRPYSDSKGGGVATSAPLLVRLEPLPGGADSPATLSNVAEAD